MHSAFRSGSSEHDGVWFRILLSSNAQIPPRKATPEIQLQTGRGLIAYAQELITHWREQIITSI